MTALTALGVLGLSSGPAFAAFECHDTAKGQVCAGNSRTSGGGAVSNAGANVTNQRGYSESGRGGDCGYHYEASPFKYVGQC
jgi:hypothetical protein